MVPQQIMHRDGTVEIVNTVQVLTKVVEYARTPVRSNVSTRQASPPPTFGISRTEKVKATRSAPPNATRSARTAQRSAAPQHVAAKAAYDDMPLINMEDEVFNDGKVHTRQQSMALVRSASKAQRSAAPLQAKCLSMSPDGVEQHHGLSLLAAKHSRAYLVLRESSKISNHADCQCRGSTSLLVQRRGARRGGGGAPGGGRPAANPPKHAA